jgi:dihydroflavonol-4-reductase
MKAIVFGGTGFIGSHVAEQLLLAGHEVTAAVRPTSHTEFLKQLGARIIPLDYRDETAIAAAVEGHQLAYNCTAGASMHARSLSEAPVETVLAGQLAKAAAAGGAERFIQLSTIVVYDYDSNQPMNEEYSPRTVFPVQRIELEREASVWKHSSSNGMKVQILRPASTIGARDHSSFFSQLYLSHQQNKYPIIGSGNAFVSLVDTRDIGRAMTWLGTQPEMGSNSGIYLLKGFEATWRELKEALDGITGKKAKTITVPAWAASILASVAERLTPSGKEPLLNRMAVKTLTVNRLWDDQKIRSCGFETIYTLKDAVQSAVHDFQKRI